MLLVDRGLVQDCSAPRAGTGTDSTATTKSILPLFLRHVPDPSRVLGFWPGRSFHPVFRALLVVSFRFVSVTFSLLPPLLEPWPVVYASDSC